MHHLCVAFNHVVVILFIKAVSILQFKPGIEEDDLSVSARESEASGSRMETETDEERDVERKEAGAAEEETESIEVGQAEVGIERVEAEPVEEIPIFNYFARPNSKDLSFFFQYHPQQTPSRTLPNIFNSRDGMNRKWLTYCEESHALFCMSGIFKALCL